jgi:flagellar hook-associated protein 3 FlgL
MQVGDLTLYDSLAGALNADQSSINTLDSELSSGLALQQPSDDPVAVVNALADQSQISQLTATTSSATTASSWLGIANNTANSVIGTLQTANTLMLQALNEGSQTSASYQQIAQQVQGIIQQLVGLGNTSYAGTAIFSGTAGVQNPYSSAGAYSGNEQSFTIQVGPGAPTAVSVPGTTLFGGGTTGIQSVFTTLQNFATHLAAGPGSTAEANIQGDLSALTANMTQAETAATTLGESSQAVTAASAAATATSTRVQTNLATTEDANVADVTTQLQSQLASYQSALYAVSQTVPETLAQFLH